VENKDDYYESEEFQELLNDYEDSLERGMPLFMDAEDLVEIADYYEGLGRRDEADEAIERALEKDPSCPSALSFKVGDALEKGDLAMGHYYLDQITDHDDPEYIYCSAELMLEEGRTKECEKMLRNGLKEQPEEEIENYVLDVLNIYCDWEEWQLAAKWMKLVKATDNDDFREFKGRIHYGMGEFDKSEQVFKQLLDDNPFCLRYWNALASSQFMLGQYKDALESSEYAIAIDASSADALLWKANALYHLGNYEEARDFFHRYSQLTGNDPLGLLNEASCLIAQDRIEEATQMLEKLSVRKDIEPDILSDVHQQLAYCYGEQQQYDQAIAVLELSESPQQSNPQITVQKGDMMLAAGKLEEAEATFHQAINESDDPMKTLLQVIVSLYDNCYLTMAHRMMGKFFSLQGDNGHDGYGYMALFCHDLGKREDYLKYLKLAVAHNLKEAEQALKHLFPKDLEPALYYTYETQQK